jgi:hypothetical protein
MAPSSGYKGVGLGLMVEVFAAALAGAELGIDAAPFSGTTGGPPRTGQFFIAVNPLPASEGRFAQKIARLAAAIADQEGARLPGARRLDARTRARTEGVPVDRALVEEIEADRLNGQSPPPCSLNTGDPLERPLDGQNAAVLAAISHPMPSERPGQGRTRNRRVPRRTLLRRAEPLVNPRSLRR